MGNKVVVFTEEQLQDYQDCTFLARKEILRIQKKFRNLATDIVPKSMTAGNVSSTVIVPVDTIVKLPELKENPFKRRICEVFSKDGSGNLTFDEFLDMLSIFSEEAPRDIKVFYAFKIYDFNNDNHIGNEDMCTTLKILTVNELNVEEMNQVCNKAIEEADVDGDGKLSYMEFNHVILRSPEFFSTFHIRI
ncbi:calcium and integrin-binding family member 2 [Halyomorpha halys]|uniref:calcium and integrin-binding family member 2 n=1 Tax=Halyomorpha halys TaxID=286706 RepID=UPI0006D4D5C8|nr:calcium and integrin-binding family member 2 [Halyomorpha halys]